MELFITFGIIINSPIAFFNGFISFWFENLCLFFRVWHDETSGKKAAMGEGLASTSSDMVGNPAAKGVSGMGIRQR